MAVPASVIVASCLCVGASACVSSGLAFCATFSVSLLFVVRELSPERIDGVIGVVDACLRREARYARATVEAETRRLRDQARAHPVLAFLYARAEGVARRARALIADAADRLKTRAEPKWRDLGDATVVALSWLRLAAGVINLAVAVLTTMAERRAASGLRRGGVNGIRTMPNTEADAALASSSSKPDATLFVVWIAATFMYSTPVFVQRAVTSGMASFAACFTCFATLCCFALMQANKAYLWTSCDVAGGNTARLRRRAGDDAITGGTVGADVPHAWELLWCEIILVNYLVDACLLCITLDSRPVALAFLAACNLATLKVARQVEANGSAGVIRWRGHAVAVCAMGIAKVFVVCLVLDFHLGALSFAFLCGVIAFLLNKAISSLPDVGAPVDDNAGYTDVTGDVELLPDYVKAENLSTRATFNHEAEEGSSSAAACDREGEQDSSTPAVFDCEEREDSSFAAACDREDGEESSPPAAFDREEEEDSSSAAPCEREEEGTTTKEHFDGSDSEELVEEQRQEEQGGGGGGIDEWNFVETDPVMPINVNGGAKGKFKRWPRKYSLRPKKKFLVFQCKIKR
ncbi:hypothetical protein E2562_005035 [Oryza meyeriana var. granulata]|uniref:Reticulon domain-containing protein n=1 Tax=Oryza meyeriana var. granulata TaxID=110450 RepID=A0A6G1BT86_9ORYZ|nr:hypothetical protein E2562_005035 [Oryza meyeriana var. granulata]